MVWRRFWEDGRGGWWAPMALALAPWSLFVWDPRAGLGFGLIGCAGATHGLWLRRAVVGLPLRPDRAIARGRIDGRDAVWARFRLGNGRPLGHLRAEARWIRHGSPPVTLEVAPDAWPRSIGPVTILAMAPVGARFDEGTVLVTLRAVGGGQAWTAQAEAPLSALVSGRLSPGSDAVIASE